MRLLLLFFLTGCTTDIMLGKKVRDGGFYGDGPTITIRFRREITEHTFCEYEHISHLLVGPPFSPSHEEDSLDHVGCGVTF